MMQASAQKQDVPLENEASLFSGLKPAPADPILGLKQKFLEDTNPSKVDLGAGVYQNEYGFTGSMQVVRDAEARLQTQRQSQDRTKDSSADYLPIDGHKGYNAKVQALLFGAGAQIVKDGKVVTAQAVGGTSALRYGADFLKRLFPDAKVYVSDPTWANHKGIFERSGFQVETYPYYNLTDNSLDFDGMVARIKALPQNSIVLLHACCHNPTGLDLTDAQWDQLVSIFKGSKLVPFLDFAYQGFAKGLEEDAFAVRKFADAGLNFLVASSFSKNFSLYNRRVGSLSIVTSSKEEAQTVLSQLKTDIRTNNSNPPRDGAEIVNTILSDPALEVAWKTELDGMRERIQSMRERFIAGLTAHGLGAQFEHLKQQNGMFSYSGLSKEHVLKLRSEYGVYIVDSGRICIASMTEKNIDYIVDSIAKVLK